MSAIRQVALREVAQIERDIVDASAIDDGTFYVGLENIESGGRLINVRPVDAGELLSSKFAFSGSHLLYGKLRPYLAKIARPNFDGICSTDILPVLPGPDLDRGYLAWLLLSPEMVARASSRASGANLPRLSPNALAELQIPLPPLPEQRRIAEILDKADTLRAKRLAALTQLDTLTQSIFLDMFGDPATNPKGWPVRTLGELFEICSSKRVLESQWKKKGIPFYRAREIVKLAKQGYVDNDLFISEELFNELSGDNGAPQAGDLMVSAVGTLGACYQVHDGDRFYFKDASVLRFIPQGEVEPAFVRHAFNTDHVLRQVHGGSGSTVGTYTIARARQTRLYLPPLSQQRRFSLLVQCAQSQSALQTTALNEVDRLFASLQHRAFRGEL